MINQIELNGDDWEDTYTLCMNYRDPRNSSWQDEYGNGRMFNAYGEDKEILDVVDNLLPYHIWSYVGTDDGTAIVNGYVWVNALGHFITQKAWQEGDDITIWVIRGDKN